jgi:hypothetical protein
MMALRSARAWPPPLEDRLVSIGGPLVDRRRLRADAAAEKVDLWNEVEVRANEIGPDLHLVVTDLRRTGLARRLAGSDERALLLQSFDVLEAVFNLNETIDIAVLATQRCGDAKALNAGNPVGSVVLRSLALLTGVATPSDEEGRRDMWERHSVICDSLSSTVLVLNVRFQGESALAGSRTSASASAPRSSSTVSTARSAGLTRSSARTSPAASTTGHAADGVRADGCGSSPSLGSRVPSSLTLACRRCRYRSSKSSRPWLPTGSSVCPFRATAACSLRWCRRVRPGAASARRRCIDAALTPMHNACIRTL